MFATAFLTISVLAGIGGTIITTNHQGTASAAQSAMPAAASDSTPEMRMSSLPVSSMSMAHMTASLTGATGDDFDRKFLSEMTAHHQGALDMAKLAVTHAKHQEVKDLANGIISSQTSQISEMKQWQKDWGYVH